MTKTINSNESSNSTGVRVHSQQFTYYDSDNQSSEQYEDDSEVSDNNQSEDDVVRYFIL